MIHYPETLRGNDADSYHGHIVADPYRWLEDDNADEVKAWIAAQNSLTLPYLRGLPGRSEIALRYRELFDFPKISAITQVGSWIIYQKNDGLQNQPILYARQGLEGASVVLIDPNSLSEAGTLSISIMGCSKDLNLVALAFSEAGSDWSEVRIMDIEQKRLLPDRLKWVKFSAASWYKDGFFYTRYPEPENGKSLSGLSSHSSVYYHRLGQEQAQDEVVFTDPEHPRRYHHARITHDEAYLTLYISTGTDGFETHYKKMEEPGWDFHPLYQGFEHKNYVVDHEAGRFLIHSNVHAPRYQALWGKPGQDIQQWELCIPERAETLMELRRRKDRLFAHYLQDATSRLHMFSLDGTSEEALPLPDLGSISMGGGDRDNDRLFWSFTSFIDPGRVYATDVQSGAHHLLNRAQVKGFDSDAYVVKQVFYQSKDGTNIPMFIVHKKGLKQNGSSPAYLYGYGGFNVSLTPGFGASRILLLEQGFVFAMPNLRGGGEYGESWHQDGMLMNKQNVFDDFIAAAEYLIETGYTSSDRLAIAGGSNGGLLVGACVNQRPDLFRVAMPSVGVMDMLRYHKFTVGWGWAPEYGTVENSKDMFRYLLAYSPLHNIRSDVDYPAILVSTADHDDRVVPAHSFKYISALQAQCRSKGPLLIRIDIDAGHGAGKPTHKIIEQVADEWAFLFSEIGAKRDFADPLVSYSASFQDDI